MKKLILFFTIAALVFLGACDMPGGDGCDPNPPSTGITVTGPIGSDVGKGVPWFASMMDLSKRGYVEEEFFFESEATYYKLDGEMTLDGMWSVSEVDKAPFKSRMIVRRPTDPSKFNGTVIVEWFNVSAGFDAGPGMVWLEQLILREGYAYVGVSAQKVGIDGGGMMNMPFGTYLTKYDPERYGSLHHPGDAYSYDIYSIAAKVIKGEGTKDVMGGLKAERVFAYGQSQSGFTLITYANGHQPVANEYDGIFIQSRAAVAVPMEGQYGLEDDDSGGCNFVIPGIGDPVRVRTDLDVPVIQLEAEADLLGFYKARQPDTDLIRTWEVPGTAHVDQFLVDYVKTAEQNLPPGTENIPCENGNKGPLFYVMRAAIKGLDQWVKDGTAPPKAGPIEMKGARIVKDEYGNAKGGVRSPHLDVPIAKYTPQGKLFNGGGEAGGFKLMDMMCAMFGGTEPFSEDTLLELYPTHADYVSKFKASTEAFVAEGFILEEDAAKIIADAEAAAIPN